MLLPSTSSVAPLLAVPALLIILREVLVSALREWTALAGWGRVAHPTGDFMVIQW